MPKLARYTLIWLVEEACYALYERDRTVERMLMTEQEEWLEWLEGQHSFAFRGSNGHLTLLREKRVRGSDYWYAYRSVRQRTLKRYAGRARDLTFAHLEELAMIFSELALAPEEEVSPAPSALVLATAGWALQQPSDASLSPRISASPPLLAPKFHAPRLRTTLVQRERLLARLDDGLESRLLLVCTPAGWGKTTLVCQWINERGKSGLLPPVAWMALDENDNDPVRFWRYVITTSRAFSGQLGSASLAQLANDLPLFEMPSLEMVLTALLNDMAGSATGGLLILEDYHLITAPRIHETLTFFLEHLPAAFHVVMLTRSLPPFPLMRWRTRGDLCEIQVAELRFSRSETAAFWHQIPALAATPLPDEVLSQLEKRAEGWAAGLRLLALAAQGGVGERNAERLLTLLGGDQRSLQDYFVTEVLDLQPPASQDFLLRTSVLVSLTGSLCDTLTGETNGAHMLEHLERAGMFLEALDGVGEWYRYHALFAESMRAEAARRLGTEVLRVLSLQAGQWYEQQGMFSLAIEATFQARDYMRAALLLEKFRDQIWGASTQTREQVFQDIHEYYTLRRWLEQLPTEVLRQFPRLCLSFVVAVLMTYILEQRSPETTDMQRFEDVLQMAEDGWRQSGDLAQLGEVFALRSQALRQRGQIKEAVDCAQQALQWLPETAIVARDMSLSIVGIGAFFDGRLILARQLTLQARILCEIIGSRPILRANTVLLSRISIEQGELRQATEMLQQLLTEARVDEDLDDIADALQGLSQISYEWNELEKTEQQALELAVLGERMGNEEFQTHSTLMLARVEFARGQYIEAWRRCAAHQANLPAIFPLRLRLSREVQAMQSQLELALGDFAAVERWWQSRTWNADESFRMLYEREKLVFVRLLLARGEPGAALAQLQSLREDAGKDGRARTLLEIQLLTALVHEAQGESARAIQLFHKLLPQAQTEGYRRLFLDEGEPLTRLLRAALPGLRSPFQINYARALLLASTGATQTQDELVAPPVSLLTEPLSPQERRVLRLLATGRSNPAIARELVVSVNTIKAHVQSIYRKLNVQNRVEASEVARMLKLL